MDQETVTNEPSSALQPLRQSGPLPSEILAEILLLTLPWIYERQAPPLKALSLITIEDNIPHVRKALSKSGEHPIDVLGESRFPEPGWRGSGDESSSSRFLATVQQHARRWRHVTLSILRPKESPPTYPILPLLQTLDIRAHFWDLFVSSDQFLALLNRQRVPFLRELSVCGVGIARFDLISLPPTLSKLEISPRGNYQFIVGWLPIIAACPNLAVFRLCHTQTTPGDGVNGDGNTAPAVVELNALRNLDLHFVHPDLILDILMRLRLPEECAISIRCRLRSPNPSTSFLIPALSGQRNFQCAGKVIQATICLIPRLEDLLVVYQRWHIYLNLVGAWAIRDALDWIFGNHGENSNGSSSQQGSLQAGLETSHSPPVTLKLGRDWLRSNHTHLHMLSDLQNINILEMNYLFNEEVWAFLFYLSRPKDPNQPMGTMTDSLQTPEPESNQEVAGVWPFPGLSELVWRNSQSSAVYRILVEPITGQCSDDAAARTSGRATRSALVDPNTPWEKVVSAWQKVA